MMLNLPTSSIVLVVLIVLYSTSNGLVLFRPKIFFHLVICHDFGWLL